MEIQKIIFLGVCISSISLIVILFKLLMKRLGKLGGDFKIISDNYRIIMPLATILIFAFMMAVVLYAYQAIWHDLFNL
jgi:uncharacterized protein HemY